MTLTILANHAHLRPKFKKTFLMPWEQFRVVYQEMIANLTQRNIPFGEAQYESSFMWDRLPPVAPVVSFDKALAALREIPGQVLFMSDDERVDGNHSLHYDGNDFPCFIAEANTKELAQQIEFEWYESYRLFELMMYDPDVMLPEDVYVFDRCMDWLIVFTHETTDWDSELDEPMKAAASRVCFLWKKDAPAQ